MKCTGTTTRSLSPQCWTALAKSLLAALLLLGLLAGQQVPVASAADPSVTLTAIGGGGTHGLPNGAFAVTSNCDTGVDTDVNEEYRVALEFDLSSIPSGAEIQAAYLRLRTGRPDLVGKTAVYAYAGSGTIEAGDMTAGSLVVTYTPSTPSPQSVDVTAAVLARWQNSQRWAGFTLRQEPLGSDYSTWDCPGYYSEPLLTVTYKASDSTPPVITPNVVGTLGQNGWYVGNITLTWSVTDAESSVTSQTGCSTQNITADTAGVTFTCSATSAGGTSTSDPVTIKRDATKPVVASATPERAPNAAGWYNAPLQVTFDGLDATSGIASCASPTYSGPDNASASVSGTCTDNAGNVSSPVGFGLNYDATAPIVVSATPNPLPNAAGWYKAPVTVNFAGSDATSGLASCAKPTYSSPDSATGSVEGSCTDKAGNTSSPVTFNLKYDATAPSTTATPNPAPNGGGWHNAPLTVSFVGSDATSGIANCTAPTGYSGPDTNGLDATGTCTDSAGNTSAPATYTIKYDATRPTVNATPDRAPNPAGWYKVPVTISFSGSDATSDIASCTANTAYSGPDGASINTPGTCTDNAGNTSTPSTFTLNYDATAPTLAPTISPNPPSLNLPAAASPNATDATSGVAGSSCAQPDTTSAGAKNLACTATDNAGNTATAQLTYTVINNAPTIAVAPGGTCSDDKASGSIKLTVGDVNTGAAGLTLRVVTNTNPQLMPNNNVVFGGSGANRTMSVTAASKKNGTATITVGVSDGVNTTTVVLTVIVGTDGNETLNGTGGTDLIFGLLGRNTLNGLGGNDLLCGGNGVDTINGGEGADTLYGNRGDDVLTGGAGADFFSGGQGSDTVADFSSGQGDTKDNTVEKVTIVVNATGDPVTGEPSSAAHLYLPTVQN